MKTPYLQNLAVLSALSLATLLSACSRSESEASKPVPVALPDPRDKAAVQEVRQAAQEAALPQPDASVALSQYVPVKSGESLMYLFHAVSGLPPDMNKLAEAVSREYRSSSDRFRRQDILKAIQPQIEAQIAEKANQRYVSWEIRDLVLQHYDFRARRFPIKPEYLSGASHFYWDDLPSYRISFTAPEALRYIEVSDEALARSIESAVSKYETLVLRVYGFAQGADLNKNSVKAVVTHVELLDKAGQRLVFQ